MEPISLRRWRRNYNANKMREGSGVQCSAASQLETQQCEELSASVKEAASIQQALGHVSGSNSQSHGLIRATLHPLPSGAAAGLAVCSAMCRRLGSCYTHSTRMLTCAEDNLQLAPHTSDSNAETPQCCSNAKLHLLDQLDNIFVQQMMLLPDLQSTIET